MSEAIAWAKLVGVRPSYSTSAQSPNFAFNTPQLSTLVDLLVRYGRELEKEEASKQEPVAVLEPYGNHWLFVDHACPVVGERIELYAKPIP